MRQQSPGALRGCHRNANGDERHQGEQWSPVDEQQHNDHKNNRGPGGVVEAATAGMPMLYTADTWNADLVKSHGAGVAVIDGDIDGLAAAILELAERYDDLHNLAMARREGAQAANSSEAFQAKLWGTN